MADKALYTTHYQLVKPGLDDVADIEKLNENADRIDSALFQKADLDEQRLVPVEQIPPLAYLGEYRAEQMEGRIGRLESMVFNNITKNPFAILFDTLEGLVVEGVWNQELQRIEF